MESVAECGSKVNIQGKDRDGCFDFDFFFLFFFFFTCDFFFLSRCGNVEAMISLLDFLFFLFALCFVQFIIENKR